MTPTRAGFVTAEDMELLALDVLDRNRVRRPPVDVDDIARREGLAFQIVRLTAISGGYLREGPGVGRAYISANEHRVRQRFTKAHELCHHLVDPGQDVMVMGRAARFPSGYDDRRKHWAHDRFAACLLMPRAWVGSFVRQRGWRMQREELIWQVARVFDVSWPAAARRLRELGHIS